jgi:phage/plasmid-like protein (TIGR03299 family)
MPALVETMAYSGKTPWHGLGTVLSEKCEIAEAIKSSGLDWTTSKQQLGFQSGEDFIQYPNRFAIVRSTDKSILGDCGPNYELLQNEKVFEWFDPFIQSDAARIHTCGALKGGSIIWVLAKLNNDPVQVRQNDTVDKYLLLSHSFDGTMSVRISFTPIRVVCWNTLSLSIRDHNSARVRIRHSSLMHDNMKLVQEAVNLDNQNFEVTVEKYKALQNRGVNQNDLKKYFRQVWEIPEGEAVSTRTKNQLETLEGLFEYGIGNQGKTMWDAYNAVTQYFSYEDGNNSNNRFTSLWFGDNARRNVKALDLAVSMSS